MELIDTIDGMTSTDYKERFKVEYKQLDIRLSKLNNMINKYYKNLLDFRPSVPMPILERQAEVMQGYKDILRVRAEIEGINLD